MATRINVRLDMETRQLLEELKLRLGWSYARIIREGILLMAAEHGFYEPKKMMNTDKFEPGIPDLGTNNVQGKDLVVKSMIYRSEREK